MKTRPTRKTQRGQEEEEQRVIKWHTETKARRRKCGLVDVSIKPWTARSGVFLRGLPKQLTPDFCFQNECHRMSTHLAVDEVAL